MANILKITLGKRIGGRAAATAKWKERESEREKLWQQLNGNAISNLIFT